MLRAAVHRTPFYSIFSSAALRAGLLFSERLVYNENSSWVTAQLLGFPLQLAGGQGTLYFAPFLYLIPLSPPLSREEAEYRISRFHFDD